MERQRRAVGFVLVLGLLVVLGGLVMLDSAKGPSKGPKKGSSDGEIDRYRTEAAITVADGDRRANGKVYTDCVIYDRHNWSTGRTISTTSIGTNPFAVLGDRSILVLSDLNRCPGSNPVVGASYRFDPNAPYAQIVNHRIAAPTAHARRYDNVDDPKVVTFYEQQALFRGGIDGLRVTEATLVIIESKPKTPLPNLYADAFPWQKNNPPAPVSSPDYMVQDRKRRFSGFIVRLNQLGENQRCDKFDREAEGPILVEGDSWDKCPPWNADNLGWLIARPNANLSRIDYSYNERSMDKIATHYRATWLEASGAPGANEGENYFFWRPTLCFDGQCFTTHGARRTNWSGFRLYYPKKNQVISVEWEH
jgi:hypothetical protein